MREEGEGGLPFRAEVIGVSGGERMRMRRGLRISILRYESDGVRVRWRWGMCVLFESVGEVGWGEFWRRGVTVKDTVNPTSSLVVAVR